MTFWVCPTCTLAATSPSVKRSVNAGGLPDTVGMETHLAERLHPNFYALSCMLRILPLSSFKVRRLLRETSLKMFASTNYYIHTTVFLNKLYIQQFATYHGYAEAVFAFRISVFAKRPPQQHGTRCQVHAYDASQFGLRLPGVVMALRAVVNARHLGGGAAGSSRGAAGWPCMTMPALGGW